MENTNVGHLLNVQRQFPHFVTWRYDIQRDGTIKKPPVSLRGSKKNPWIAANWCWYANWFSHLDKLGFFLTESCDLTCIDIDGKTRNPALDSLHCEILADFSDTYCEFSPSGKGAHIWCFGTFNDTVKHKFSEYGVEFYCRNRYMTITRNPLVDCPIVNGIERVTKWLNRFSPPDKHTDKPTSAKISTLGGGGVVNGGSGSHPNIYDLRSQPETLSDVYILRSFIARTDYEKCALLHSGNWQAVKNKNGTQRYSTQSEADQAFCNVIAFYTDDPVQVAKVFMHSRLSWNINRHSQQYLWRTIQTAFNQKGGA